MGALFFVRRPDVVSADKQLDSMLACSPYRGRRQTVCAIGNAHIAVQFDDRECSWLETPAAVCAVHGFAVGNRDSNNRPARRAAAAILLADWGERQGDWTPTCTGAYAYLLLDKRSGTLFFGNTLDGSQPLYVAHDHDAIYIATEIRQVRSGTGLDARLDREGFFQLITRDAAAPDPAHTPYAGVTRCINGARYALAETDRTPRLLSEFRLPPPPDSKSAVRDRSYWRERLHDLMVQIVADYRPDSPAGMLLSGGLDSSVIWALLNKGHDNSSGIEAFSVVYPGRSNDESGTIAQLHDFLGTRGTRLDGHTWDPSAQLAEQVNALDHLLSFGSLFELDPVLELARQQGRSTLLSGLGADEWLTFGRGYLADNFWTSNPFRTLHLLMAYQPKFSSPWRMRMLKSFVRLLLLRRGGRLDRLLRRPQPPGWLHRRWTDAWREREHENALMHARHPRDHGVKLDILDLYRAGVPSDFGEQRLAQYGIHGRHPFRDQRLIQLAFEIPTEAADRTTWKELQRLAFAKHLPTTVLSRKRGVLHDDPRKRQPPVLPTLGRIEDWALVQYGFADAVGLKAHAGTLEGSHTSYPAEQLASTELFLRGRFSG